MRAYSANDEAAVAVPTSRWMQRLLYAVLGASALATTILSGSADDAIAASALLLGLVAAGSFFIIRSRSLGDRERRAWRLVGLGLLIAASGIVVHAVVWLTVGDIATFGPFDLIWLLGYGVGIAGVSLLPHTAGSKWQRLRLLLDGAIGAVATGTLLWTVSLRELTADLGTSTLWARIVGSSYVLLDATILVVLMIVVIKRSTYRFDRRLVFFGIAAIAQGIADFAFLTSGLGRSFNDTEPIYWLHIFAITMFLAAAANVSRVPEPREYADRASTPAWEIIVPYGLAAILVGFLVTRFPSSGASAADQTLLHASVLIAGLVIARQGVAIRESRRSLEDQRSDLAASISHELRTPLTALVGFLELLNIDAFEEAAERREITSIVNDQASYLARIVSDLLMLTSDSITGMELEIEAIPIDELAWCAVNAAAIDPSLVRVDAQQGVTAFLDDGRMQQALANLLGNAVRYGGEKVEVVAGTPGGDLLIEVHDDGPGVPRKYELTIWEKFERGPNRLNATVPGSGIGLAVTNAIAKAHGGTAGYRRSERLGGACFWIRLPGRVRDDRAGTIDTVPRLSVIEGDAKTA